MHFELSQEELNSLDSCEKQIGFISDLCNNTEGVQGVSMVGLMCFLDAMKDTLSSVVKVAEERHAEQYSASRNAASLGVPHMASIPQELVVRMMCVCGGEILSEEEVVQLCDELDVAAGTQGAGEVLEAFHAALRRAGYEISRTQTQAGTQFTIKRPALKVARNFPQKSPRSSRKRDKLIQA